MKITLSIIGLLGLFVLNCLLGMDQVETALPNQEPTVQISDQRAPNNTDPVL